MTHKVRTSSTLLLGISIALLAPQAKAQATTPCTQVKGAYTCSRAAFQQTLKNATTITVETRTIDRNGHKQLEDFVASLGKTLKAEGQPADLIFVLMPIDFEGVRVGPSGSNLATLSVYAGGPEGKHGPLVWSETFSGQPDMRWPSVVHALIHQFNTEFNKH